MMFLRDTGKKKSTGRLVRVLAALFAVIFAFTSLPATDASADTSKALNPGYIFRDETPESTGIPAYYHKGVKYAQLNENEKKIFDQVVLLHLYLTDANRDNNSLLAPYVSCLNSGNLSNNHISLVGGNSASCFEINFNKTTNEFALPSIEVSVPKMVNASGEAIEFYGYNEINSDDAKLKNEMLKLINIQKAMEAVFVDLPDVFWWNKSGVAWDYNTSGGSDANKISIGGFKFYLAAQWDDNGSYYKKDTIPGAMTKINNFADRVISEVESKGFWETVKGGEEAVVTEVPGVLSDYDKLVGTALMLEKLIKYDTACIAAGGNVDYARKSSLGIDCVTQYDGWGTHLYDSSDKIEAVCEGYSEIYKYICDRTCFYNDVKVGIEIGYIENNNVNPVTYGRHEWNIAEIGGNYYVIDLTNDDANWLRGDLGIGSGDIYKYKKAFFMKGKPVNALIQQPSRGEGYRISYSFKSKTDGKTYGITPFYLFGGAIINNPSLPLVTEAVGYEPYEKDFIDKSKCSAKLYVPEGDGNYVLDTTFNNENGTPRITYKSGNVGDRTLIVWAENASLIADSYDYELIKGDGTLVTRSSLSYANNPYIVIGDPFSFAPGEYSIYLYAKDGSYEFPVTGPKFTVLPATLTPSVVIKNGANKVTIAPSEITSDLKDRFEIKLAGVASGDTVTAEITNLELTNVVDSTTTAEGSAGVSATFRLTGTHALNYVLANNNTTTVTLDNAVTISKKQDTTSPDQGGGTSGGGGSTSGGGTSGGGGSTSGGGTSGGGGSTSGGGSSGGGGSTSGGGSSGGGAVSGGGSSGGGAVSGGGASGGGAISGGGGAAGGSGASAGEDKESPEKDDKSAEKDTEDKQDKAEDNKTSEEGKTSETKPEVVTNDDGSTTTTNTTVNKKGSVIVESKTENADGSTVESVIKTTKSGNITETTVEKDADGNVTATVEKTVKTAKADKDGKVKTTANTTETDAEGNTVKTKETTVVDKKGNTEITSKKTEKDSNGKTTLTTTTTAVLDKKGSGTVEVEKKSAGGASVTESYSVSSKGVIKLTGIEVKGDELVIPETVEMSGEAVPVTTIGKNAMKNNKLLTSAVIGENITTIGAGAFSGNKNLANIELTGSIKKISKNAFKNIAKDAVFTIHGTQKDLERITKLLKESGISNGITIVLAD